jgi:catechol 2,3-dioxygenase-like lactoylglutathione lyase family enzyme
MPEPQSKPIARLKKISPQFVVPDVVTAAEYYRDVFGFTIRGYWQNPPVFAIVARDDVEIQLGKADARESPAPNTMRRKGGLDVYNWVSDVDTLYAELRDRGSKNRRTSRIANLQVLRNGGGRQVRVSSRLFH